MLKISNEKQRQKDNQEAKNKLAVNTITEKKMCVCMSGGWGGGRRDKV